MNGIIVIDKPKGYTSFDVVAVMRGLLKQKKIGHTGTLDPMATGVLPILIGSATKAQSILPDEDKEYIAKFRLGISTDTLDITGNIISRCKVTCTEAQVLKKLELFRGEIYQVPPMYSAVKKDGKRLYELARSGIEVKREKRKVFIHEIDLIKFNDNDKTGTIRVRCSKGTYIRTLCDDLGKALNCGATLEELRRTKACSFTLEDSITLDEAKELSKNDLLLSKIINTDRLFLNYKSVNLSAGQEKRYRNGAGLSIDRINLNKDLDDGSILRVYNQDNEFLGLSKVDEYDQELKVYKMFCVDRI